MQKNMFIIFIYKLFIRNNWLVYIKPERFNTHERSVSLVPQGEGGYYIHLKIHHLITISPRFCQDWFIRLKEEGI